MRGGEDDDLSHAHTGYEPHENHLRDNDEQRSKASKQFDTVQLMVGNAYGHELGVGFVAQPANRELCQALFVGRFGSNRTARAADGVTHQRAGQAEPSGWRDC